MTPSSNLIDIIKHFEGLFLHPYLCPAGVPTIGYGSTRYPNGTKVTMQDKPITEGMAQTILLATLQNYTDAVNRYVKVPLNQNQFDALVDFAYNVGNGAFLGSTLLKLLNLGNYKQASLEFNKWTHADGKVLEGLVKRRQAETDLFKKVG